ncbi:hypothetical protein DFP91_3451 [Pseudorhodoplanes sinuspersici]|uniref:Uncharacterized protein n=1 Tax=Pseudorhodoplanes sinuspersici TaxID=1235591 RepID=A0A1W6ZQA1_9HYPH|nr:hypothetical protein CAK95_09505 [Pseudorhodoplanes sinuspersici]RKE69027.1 hypothetical protein DFP91_3451 [Pseudorhodoplanes sinuspersici]
MLSGRKNEPVEIPLTNEILAGIADMVKTQRAPVAWGLQVFPHAAAKGGWTRQAICFAVNLSVGSTLGVFPLGFRLDSVWFLLDSCGFSPRLHTALTIT